MIAVITTALLGPNWPWLRPRLSFFFFLIECIQCSCLLHPSLSISLEVKINEPKLIFERKKRVETVVIRIIFLWVSQQRACFRSTVIGTSCCRGSAIPVLLTGTCHSEGREGMMCIWSIYHWNHIHNVPGHKLCISQESIEVTNHYIDLLPKVK